MSEIAEVHARQILDSRGYPTVEVEIALRSGAVGRAAVPGGGSTGRLEATELRDGGAAVGADGGFAPDLESNENALEALVAAIRAAGYEPGWDVWIGIDAAASQLRVDGRYSLAHEGRELSSADLASYYDELTDRYPVLILETGMTDDDWEGWRDPTARLGQRLELAGDDVFVTTAERLRRGITGGIANAIVIKPNQVGTFTETLETIAVAHDGGYATVVAHRSGETEDTTIYHDLRSRRGHTIRADQGWRAVA